MVLGYVYLVGAGCGEADLITVRGMQLLKHCDVVVFDDLIAPQLLNYVPLQSERICVGKRAGRHSMKQEDINALLIKKAAQGKLVVRLKGGDPFVFGRGGEECMALSAVGIPFSVVPGVSSALAIPMEAGIPVTHRGASRSVHIVTAHTAQSTLPEDIPKLAALDGTLVFLMGLHALDCLARELIASGKRPKTPCAVLSGGNSPHPAQVRGTLDNIAEKTKSAGVLSPAVIVIGSVAGIDVRCPQTSDLSGASIGLTGTDEFQQKLAALLEQHGLKTSRVQRARCISLPVSIPWERFSGKNNTFGKWIAFTSRKGVELFFQQLMEDGVDIRDLAACQFAVIGPATGKALAGRGILADLCPAEYTGAALAQGLLNKLSATDGEGAKPEVNLFDSAKSFGAISNILASRGVCCHRISLYNTVYETIRTAQPPRYLLLGSAGAVNALADDGYTLEGGVTPVCIGPATADAFERRFYSKPLVPDEITAESMVETVLKHLRAGRS